MIQIQNLTYHYKRSSSVFLDISINIKKGNICGLLGENGVGKTTLLRLISGLLFSDTGICKTFGYESKRRLPQMLEKIYYLPEEISIPSMNVIRYGKIYGNMYPNFNAEQFTQYLNKFGIDRKKLMTNFSHGQQKKAIIAFALACNTELLLMDEPTNGLDIPSKSIFRQVIAETIDDNRTILISTHQVRDLENLIDPIIILENNQILLNNTISEISDKLRFVMKPEQSTNVLYQEQTPGGFLCVEPNDDRTESKLNIEWLFNAAIHNKDYFKKTFIQESPVSILPTDLINNHKQDAYETINNEVQ